MRNIESYKNRFYNLMESTIGNVKPLISEQSVSGDTTQTPTVFDKNYFISKKQGTITLSQYGKPLDVDGVKLPSEKYDDGTDFIDYDTLWNQYFSIENIGGRGFAGQGNYKWVYSEKSPTGIMGPNQEKPGLIITDESGSEVGTFIFK
jgi:hypothetical protein